MLPTKWSDDFLREIDQVSELDKNKRPVNLDGAFLISLSDQLTGVKSPLPPKISSSGSGCLGGGGGLGATADGAGALLKGDGGT